MEVNELKERLDIEKQGWIENYMKKQVRSLTISNQSSFFSSFLSIIISISFQDAVLMAKERELKEAVREGRDRVSQEVFFCELFVLFCFLFCHFLSFSHELKYVTIRQRRTKT